jgi:polyisoprenoid-binding protein YceI
MAGPRAGQSVLAILALAATSARPALAQGGGAAPGTRWVVDLVHSQVDFRVRHLVGRVRGTFTDWYAILISNDRDWSHGTVRVSVQTGSLNTGNSYRDADLRSDRFFSVDSFPTMTFEGTGIIARDSTVELRGNLTLKGRTRPVRFTGQYRGVARDAEGHERVAFDGTATVDRRDFGIDWNQTVAGNPLIGNDVEITIAIEAIRID